MTAANNMERARKLSEEGQSLLGAGDHERALAVFTEAARAFGLAGDIRSQASCQRMVADICLIMKRPEQALESCEQTLGLIEKIEDPEMQAQVMANMGLIEAQSGRSESAVARFHQSRKLFESLGNTLCVAQQWGNIGSSYRDMQEYDRAMESYHRALPLYEGLGHTMGMADQYTNMAYIHSMRNELMEALRLYQKAVPLYKQAGDIRKADLTMQNVTALQSALDVG
jgi:tetratricopeptide (TPR) repeat protein